MKLSKITESQWLKVGKAALYVGASATLDYLIAQTAGTPVGSLTFLINVVLVTVKQAFSRS